MSDLSSWSTLIKSSWDTCLSCINLEIYFWIYNPLPALSPLSPSSPNQFIINSPQAEHSPVQLWSVAPLAPPRTPVPITPSWPVYQSAPCLLSSSQDRPYNSALVSHHSSCAMDFRDFHPFSGLILPSSYALDLSCSCLCLSPPAPWLHLVLADPPCPPGPSEPLSSFCSSSSPGSPQPVAPSQSVVILVPGAKPPPWLLPLSIPPWDKLLNR